MTNQTIAAAAPPAPQCGVGGISIQVATICYLKYLLLNKKFWSMEMKYKSITHTEE